MKSDSIRRSNDGSFRMNSSINCNVAARLATWYLRDFGFHRGKGVVNRLLGRFLRITTSDGIKLRLTNPLEYNQRTLLYTNSVYEPEVTSIMSSILEAGNTFFDVGANLGYYTLLASKRVGFHGQVHAFEPAPQQFEHLSLNVRINRATNVVLNNVALSEAPGEREMLFSLGWNQGTHSFGVAEGATMTGLVRCRTIDEYVASNRIKQIDVLKVDVEGAELLVFRGAEKTIRSFSIPVIFFEACEHHSRALGNTTIEVKSYLRHLGYDIFRLNGDSGFERTEDVEEEFANLIAIHARAKDRLLKISFQQRASIGN